MDLASLEDAASPAGARRASLEDVAERAGVSLATASRALSGQSVRPASLQKVEEAANALRYRPNLAAQAMARGSSRTVAVVVDALRSDLASATARGVIAATEQLGLLVTMTAAATHRGGLLGVLRDVRALRPRAIIVAWAPFDDQPTRLAIIRELRSYEQSGGRVAILGDVDLPFDISAFAEGEAASSLAAELVVLGYRHPLIVAGPAGGSDARVEGLRGGFGSIAAEVVRTSGSRSGASATIAALSAENLGAFDLISCTDDAIALGVGDSLRERGFRIGGDIAVSGFGDSAPSAVVRPRLTTVAAPIEVAAQSAVQRLLDSPLAGTASVGSRLRLRESTPGRSDRVGNPVPPPERMVTKIITLVIPGHGSHMYQEVAEGLGASASAAGYRLIVTDSSDASIAEADVIREAQRGSDAVALYAPRMLSSELDALLPEVQPAVVIDRRIDGRLPAVMVDYAEAMQTLADHLVGLGHRRLVHLAGPEWSPSQRERERGLRLFEQTHPEVTIERITCGWSVDDGYAAWPVVRDCAATGVLAFNDMVAIGLLGRLNEERVAVPEAISVAGLDDLPFARFATPMLTTMSVPLRGVGVAAWAALGRMLSGLDGPAQRMFEPRLIQRDSTGPAPR